MSQLSAVQYASVCLNMNRLTLSNYESLVHATLVLTGEHREILDVCRLGLLGEAGQLVSEIKKQTREADAYHWHEARLTEEFGDYLWYLVTYSSLLQVSLDEWMPRDLGIDDNGYRRVSDLPLSLLQNAANLRPESSLDQLPGSVLDFSNATTQLAMAEPTERGAPQLMRNRIATAFAAYIRLANDKGIPIEIAAQQNIYKTHDRWPPELTLPPLFDEDYDFLEQLPRNLTISVIERPRDNRTVVYQMVGDLIIGDELTDNITDEDDYRFHDVFHWAYAATLGWSPVIRRLLKRKRKSQPSVDENEDGARAAIMEEAISLWIFQNAKRRDYFEGLEHLDYDLLKNVRMLTLGHEVQATPLWLWERAILTGFQAFRFIREHRAADIHIDLRNRLMTWSRSCES